MDADDLGALLDRLQRQRQLPPSRWSAGASLASAPIIRLRLAPSTSGQPSAVEQRQPVHQLEIMGDDLPKPMPGSTRICRAPMPAASAAAIRSSSQ